MKLPAIALILIFASLSKAWAFNIKEESTLNFNLNSSVLDKGDVQGSFQFIDLSQVSSFKDVLSIDSLNQVELALAGPASPQEEILRIRKILVTKTAARLNKPIADLQKMQLDQISTIKNILNFEFDPSCQNLCTVAQKIHYFLFSLTVKMELEVRLSALAENASANTQDILNTLGVKDSVFELNLKGRNWSNIFTLSDSVVFFVPHNERTTDVVIYQILSIKKASYSAVPGLDGAIRSILKDQTKTMIQYFRKPGSTRGPASSEYDKDLYQQTYYQLDDPVGDAALLDRSIKIPLNLLKFFVRKAKSDAPKEDWTPETFEAFETSNLDFAPTNDPTKPSIQGRLNPIKVEQLSLALGQVIKEEYLAYHVKPTLGTVHQWSSSLALKYKTTSLAVALDKVFVTLCLGFTNRFLKTGTESDLRKWILQQKYNSVTVPELFRASYEINGGDVYLSLLTIENILASNWRYSKREGLPITRRLKPISKGYNYDSDRYGTWYHFFGMALYGYIKGGISANAVGHIEALGSTAMSVGVDKTQKQWMNKKGGYVGQNLKRMLVDQSWKNIVLKPENLSEDNYLDRIEDYRDRLTYTLSDQIKVDSWGHQENLESLHLKNLAADLLGCQVDIMFDTVLGLDSRDLLSFTNEDLLTNKDLMFLSPRNSFKSARIFVFNCKNSKDTFVMETKI